MWDRIHTSLTVNGQTSAVVWTTEFRRPTRFGCYWDKLETTSAIGLVGELHQWGHLDGVVGLLGAGVVPRYFDAPRRMGLLRTHIAQGAIIAWREIPDFKGPSYADRAVPNEILAPMYREHARRIGMHAGTVVAPPPDRSGHKPAIPAAADVPAAERGQALRNTVDDSCPENNWRSETHRTASPEVIRWLRDPKKEGIIVASKQDKILGYNGGGGFLSSTTRISQLKKGDILYRYYDADGGSSNSGGWWTTDLVMGDPRQTLALPPAEPGWSNSAKSLARARIAFDVVTALTGLGAPRCSNKPGGPQQWYIALEDRKNNVLCHPDDPTKPFPREP